MHHGSAFFRDMAKGIKVMVKTTVYFFLWLFFVLAVLTGFMFYGPNKELRDIYITTAMTTMSHQYLATWFFSDEVIENVMKSNQTLAPSENTNRAQIIAYAEAAETESGSFEGGWSNEAEKIRSDTIELMDISRGKFKGKLMIVHDPARVIVGSTNRLGQWGMQLEDMVEHYDAIGGVNAGGFLDINGHGKGGRPVGLLIENHRALSGTQGVKYNLIGFDAEDVLVLGRYTLKEASAMGIRDAVSFKPFLIVNGKPVDMRGNGGWGLQPRTAIGQTRDGKVLLLVIDGRQVASIGATMKDVQDILLEYGAYNAANLDGGSSAAMYYEGELINNPCSMKGGRYLPSAFLITEN